LQLATLYGHKLIWGCGGPGGSNNPLSCVDMEGYTNLWGGLVEWHNLSSILRCLILLDLDMKRSICSNWHYCLTSVFYGSRFLISSWSGKGAKHKAWLHFGVSYCLLSIVFLKSLHNDLWKVGKVCQNCNLAYDVMNVCIVRV
jgi:hypothetical protein